MNVIVNGEELSGFIVLLIQLAIIVPWVYGAIKIIVAIIDKIISLTMRGD